MEHQLPPAPTPSDVAADLAHELVRCFAAVAAMSERDLGAPGWSPREVADELQRRVARRVHDYVIVYGTEETLDWIMLLAEAIDNLGNGDQLNPETVAAFRRPDVDS
jgi:hypothetical protein